MCITTIVNCFMCQVPERRQEICGPLQNELRDALDGGYRRAIYISNEQHLHSTILNDTLCPMHGRLVMDPSVHDNKVVIESTPMRIVVPWQIDVPAAMSHGMPFLDFSIAVLIGLTKDLMGHPGLGLPAIA